MENIVAASNAEIKIFKNDTELHLNAAGYICASIRHFINSRGKCTAVLSGGNTPKKLYDVISNSYKESVEWNKVFFFWGDERCVPPSSNESNYKMANEHLLSKLPVPKENIFRIPGEKSPEEAAVLYETELEYYFGKAPLPSFDIMLLGVGTDGHTASLFPGTDALKIKNKMVVPVHNENLKSWRVTMTFPVINNSKDILIIAEGKEKTGIIDKIFNDENTPLPIKNINALNGKLTWFIDKDASELAFPFQRGNK